MNLKCRIGTAFCIVEDAVVVVDVEAMVGLVDLYYVLPLCFNDESLDCEMCKVTCTVMVRA
jgi:hypothetical protein